VRFFTAVDLVNRIPGEAQSSPISVEGIMTGVALFGRLTIVPSPS